MTLRLKQPSVLPGFGLTLGYTLFYLSLIVLIPLSALFIKTNELSWAELWKTVSDPRVVASYRLTLGASFVAAMINVVFGFIVAWVLVRYRFPGKRIVDAFVDLPFALPTAVSGIALTAIYSQNGWVGQYLEQWNGSGFRAWLDSYYIPAFEWLKELPALGIIASFIPSDLEIKAAYSWLGVTIALTFIGLPFVVRTVQPALEELEKETEEAAASLGASRWQTFRRVIFPTVLPATITGFALSFARAIGEYGSVVFIAGNMPGKTEITSLLIITKLEQYDYAGATAIALVMLLASFTLLLLINLLQWWASAKHRKTA
jgi:sulfate transport system permease protein